MGLICEYFLAPSDEAAAATADRVGGPGRPDEPAPARRRGLFRRAAPADVSPGPEAPIYPTVDGGGVEPIVELGQLEALLTGQPADTVLDVNAASGILAERRGGGLLVVRVSDALVAVLADASAEELVAVARPWSQIEEFGGLCDPSTAADWLGELADLARQGRDRGEAMYCWVSV